MIRYKIVADTKQEEFENAYSLYKESFPAGELETKSRIKVILGETGRSEKYPRDFWLVSFEESQVIGLATLQYLSSLDAAFLGYLVVKKEYRGKGLGTALAKKAFMTMQNIHDKISPRSFLGIFCEIDFLKGNSSIRRKRLLFWSNLGMCPLKVAWRYPQLTTGTKPSGMYLAFWPSSKEFIAFSRQQMAEIVERIYESIYNNRKSDIELECIRRSIANGPQSITFRI